MTDRYESRASTHAAVCWSWGPAHYECAVREIERMLAEVARLNALIVRPEHSLSAEANRHYARAERLAEAIKAYKSEWDNPVKDYLLRAKRRDEMFALLREQEEEK